MLSYHNVDIKEIEKDLQTDIVSGLTESAAEKKLQADGKNEIRKEKKKSDLIIFLSQFNAPLIYILLISSAISILFKDYAECVVILSVVIVNAIIGYIQEIKASNALSGLAKSLKLFTNVIRNGERKTINSSNLVAGDIIELAEGEKIPADIRIISSDEFHVDESSLTGESVPVFKNPDIITGNVPLGDRSNILHAGTFVISGAARGIVIATGAKTAIGKIADMIANADTFDTPLTANIKKMSAILMWTIMGLAAFTFFYGIIIDGKTISDMFSFAIALAVAMIPEGLPTTVTIILAFGVFRMSKRRAIVRKLPAVETLGGASVICSDKTGTLTENKMTVKKIFSGGVFYEVDGTGYTPDGKIIPMQTVEEMYEEKSKKKTKIPDENFALDDTILSGVLCNDSYIEKSNGKFIPHGDPTEISFLFSAYKYGIDFDAVKKRFNSNWFIQAEALFTATVQFTSRAPRLYCVLPVEILIPTNK